MNNLTKIATIDFPTRFGEFTLTTFKTEYADQPAMHYALVLVSKKAVNLPAVRIQSSCIFGEVFHNIACDCGEQLEESMKIIGEQGGIICYLDQEGRGHGIITKTLELAAQEKDNLDTVEASEKLGLKVDERNFTVVGDILKLLNIPEIKLITNNPKKIRELEATGIKVVERIPLEIEPNDHSRKYLTAKKNKLGHMLTNV